MGRCYRASASIGIYGFSDDGFTLRLMLPDAGSHTYEDGSLSKTFQSHKQAVAWAKSQGFKEPPALPSRKRKAHQHCQKSCFWAFREGRGLETIKTTSQDLPSQAAVCGDVAAKPGVAASGMAQEQDAKLR